MSNIEPKQDLDVLLAKINGQIPANGSELHDNQQNSMPISKMELAGKKFVPRCPQTLEQAKISDEEVLSLVIKYLLYSTSSRSSAICSQVKLPRSIIDPLLSQWKTEQLITIQKAGLLDDYMYTLTDNGANLAKRRLEINTYFGSAPVELEDYINSVAIQSVIKVKPTPASVKGSFHDMSIGAELLGQVGRAVYAGSGMFLYGNPGNGKTSIAERLTRVFGDQIWIPRTLKIHDEVIRLYDPSVHIANNSNQSNSLDDDTIDNRWVCIDRPMVAVGGELTMDQLELTKNKETGINEAPVQLKSNCGVLLVDDFGRQQMSTTELLNRWIVPLEKRYDFLNMASGRKIQVPFDQHVVFSTNLEPKELVDEAFLRRIPYKIHVTDPTESEFRDLIYATAQKKQIPFDTGALDHLISEHYKKENRGFRFCHARDIISQVETQCEFNGHPRVMSIELINLAAESYFGLLETN
jgi:hypothetical protein